MDYQKIFDSVFENACSEELGCFLRNEDVPFEYCQRALKKKGVGWQNKFLIAMRSDCPTSVIVKMCKNVGERFVNRLLTEKKDIPDEVIRELFKKDWMVYSLAQYWKLPDDIKSEMFKRFVTTDDSGAIIRYDDYLATFLEHQCSFQ